MWTGQWSCQNKFINNALGHIVEGEIFVNKSSLDELKVESKLDVPTFDDTYCAVSVIQLQTAFCVLMLGYVLAVVCLWLKSCGTVTKGRGLTSTSVTDRHK
jgi:hypothetical protein